MYELNIVGKDGKLHKFVAPSMAKTIQLIKSALMFVDFQEIHIINKQMSLPLGGNKK